MIKLPVLAIVKVADDAGAVMVTLLILVAVATPSVGVVIVGLVRVLLVSVSVVALPTRVSVLVGSVREPPFDIVDIIGAVNVLLVSVDVLVKVINVLVKSPNVIFLDTGVVEGLSTISSKSSLDAPDNAVSSVIFF